MTNTFKFQIYSRWDDCVVREVDLDASLKSEPYEIQLGAAVKQVVAACDNLQFVNLRGANLRGADLRDTNLRGVNLRGANLCDADLRDVNLRGADLSGANLSGANLRYANLCNAYLRDANLNDANLFGANLRRANLSGASLVEAYLGGANLSYTYLIGANLSDANLYEANLTGADLCGANLHAVQEAELVMATTVVAPPEGEVIGWKKCHGPNGEDVLVKVRVPAEARRSNASGRKCRAEFVDVLEVVGAEYGISIFDGKTKYRVGQRVTCNHWDEYRWYECGGGIHFFITRAEAEAY